MRWDEGEAGEGEAQWLDHNSGGNAHYVIKHVGSNQGIHQNVDLIKLRRLTSGKPKSCPQSHIHTPTPSRCMQDWSLPYSFYGLSRAQSTVGNKSWISPT